MSLKYWVKGMDDRKHSFNRCFSRLMVVVALVLLVGVANTATGATIDVTAYGAVGNGTTDDTSSIQSAVAALGVNDVLLFPATSAYYKVSFSSNFAINDAGVRVIVQGRIVADGTPLNANHVFSVTADDVEIIGEGRGSLEGDGTFIGAVLGDGPSLIKFNGVDGCTVRSLKLVNAPCYGVCIWTSTGCKITENIFEGGPVSTSLALWAVKFDEATDLLIEANTFKAGSNGGMMYEWIGSPYDAGVQNNKYVTIVDNQFTLSHHDAIHCYDMSSSVVANNAIKGSNAVAILVAGIDNVIANNNISDALGGGILIRNASQCIVAKNIIDSFDTIGIDVYPTSSFSDDTTDNLIQQNFIRGMDSSLTVYEGIRVYGRNAAVEISRTKIAGNTIINAPRDSSVPAINIWSVGTSYRCSVTGNTIYLSNGDGISLTNIDGSLVSDNVIQVPAGKSIVTSTIAGTNLITDNLQIGIDDPLLTCDIEPDGDIDIADFVGMAAQWVSRISYTATGGIVTMEAERYTYNEVTEGEASERIWLDQSGAGSLGSGYVEAFPDERNNVNTDIEDNSPLLSYEVNFSTAGDYYLWLKGMAPGGGSDSLHYGIDGVAISDGANTCALVPVGSAFGWLSTTPFFDTIEGEYARPIINVPSAGTHTVDIWMREDGLQLDRVLLTTDENYDPSISEPTESSHFPADLSADVNFDGIVGAKDFAIFAGQWADGL